MRVSRIRTYIVVTLMTFLLGCASGSPIVTGTVRDPIDFNLVKLYLDPPEKYEKVAIVKASSDAGWTEQGSQDYAVEELKKQAAKLGANGVLLTGTGKNVSTIINTNPDGTSYSIPVSEQAVTGVAIYVSE